MGTERLPAAPVPVQRVEPRVRFELECIQPCRVQCHGPSALVPLRWRCVPRLLQRPRRLGGVVPDAPRVGSIGAPELRGLLDPPHRHPVHGAHRHREDPFRPEFVPLLLHCVVRRHVRSRDDCVAGDRVSHQRPHAPHHRQGHRTRFGYGGHPRHGSDGLHDQPFVELAEAPQHGPGDVESEAPSSTAGGAVFGTSIDREEGACIIGGERTAGGGAARDQYLSWHPPACMLIVQDFF
mmetsp:Transcript_92874/g.265162  ORF Transcript_92874/g.265162 Transcript_92874/m.265162 type:complete len:237 (+) Transcript_92874:614-1324(+)